MNKNTITLLLITGLIFSFNAFSVESENVNLISSMYDNIGLTFDVVQEGNYIYAASGFGGLQIFDVSNPEQPALHASLNLSGEAREIAVCNGTAYLACNGIGLHCVDISNPQEPSLLATVESDQIFDVTAINDTVYTCSGWAGVIIYDCQDPAVPVVIGRRDLDDYCWGLTVDLPYIYVLGYWDGLKIVDFSNMNQPLLVGLLPVTDAASFSAKRGDYLYIADGSAGLICIDVSNPQNPIEANLLIPPPYGRNVKISGDYAFLVSDYNQGIIIIDISNPPEMAIISSIAGISLWDVFVADDILYVAAMSHGVACLDISNLAEPAFLGQYETEYHESVEVVVNGDFAYIYEGLEIKVVNISDPLNPVEISSLDVPYCQLETDGTYLYSANYSNGFQIIDISEPTDLRVLSTFERDGYRAVALDVQDTLLVTTDETGYSFSIFDISDPEHPEEINTITSFEWTRNAVFQDTILVVFNPWGLVTYDISDLNNIVDIGGYINNRYQFFQGEVQDSVAYAINWTSDNLWYFDLSDPSNPTFINRTPVIAYMEDFEIRDNYAYLATLYHGMRVWDLSNFQEPFEAGYYNDNGCARGLTVRDDIVYLANTINLSILDVDAATEVIEPELKYLPSTVVLHHPYPNPFNSEVKLSFTLPQSSFTKLKIYDIQGREVILLTSGEQNAGHHVYSWSGINNQGKPVSSGVYIVQLESNNETVSKRISLVK